MSLRKSSRDARAATLLQAELDAANARIQDAEDEVDFADGRTSDAAKAAVTAFDDLIDELEDVSEAAAALAKAAREELVAQLMPLAAIDFD